MTPLSPSADTVIARPYGIHSLEQKVQNKVALQEELGWTPEPKRAMVCLPTGMSEKLGGELLKEVLPGLLMLPIEIVILGKGSSSYGAYLTEIAKEHRHRVAIINNDEASVRKMFAAADMSLFLAESTTMPELHVSMRYGTIPVCPANKILTSYDPNQESGEAFVFEKMSPWLCFAAVVRALETYRFPFDWRTIQKHCMEKMA